MDGVDAELEEFLVAVAVGLALQGFDFVVESFPRAGGDFAAVVIQESGPMGLEGARHFHQHRKLRRLGPAAPVVEELGRGGEVVLIP